MLFFFFSSPFNPLKYFLNIVVGSTSLNLENEDEMELPQNVSDKEVGGADPAGF